VDNKKNTHKNQKAQQPGETVIQTSRSVTADRVSKLPKKHVSYMMMKGSIFQSIMLRAATD